MFLHRFTKAVAVASFLLLVVGGLVASTGAGLAVPDWPTSYGRPLFALPYSDWVGGIFYQQGHRLLGAAVGLLTVGLAAAFIRAETRRWMKALPVVAVALVVAQGLLGGFTVLRGLPAVVSSTHAGLAQIFFALVVALALFTSRGWLEGYDGARAGGASTRELAADATLRHLSVATIAFVYLQVLLGAVVRHVEAAQAIPDYPLAFGRIVPPLDALALGPVAIGFAHRIAAVVLTALVTAVAWRVLRRHRERRELLGPAGLMAALVATEIVLGAMAVLAVDNTVVGAALGAAGALLLATTVVFALRVHRPFFRPTRLGEGRGQQAAHC